MSDLQREFWLGDWQVIPLRGVIQGAEGSRKITPRAMDVLLCLARHAGEVVSRDTFLEEVWDGRAFSDDPLNRSIAELRRQLGDSSSNPTYIQTIPKRGYRLVANVTPIGEPLDREQRAGAKKPLRVFALAVLFVLAAIGTWHLTRSVVPDGRVDIAVLPFASLSESGKQYFADGVHEDLIRELSHGESFAVRSRTSTLQYRERLKSIPEIATELGVDVVVEGSVRQDGDTVRVSAQVIRASDDESLWADSFERSLSVAGLFAIQNEIAHEIANALKVELGGSSRSSARSLPTTSIEAYDAFMLGKFHYRRQLPGDIRESVLRFERAVALDPQFAEAWDWLAYAYNHAATSVGYLAPSEAYPKARAAALRALEIEPELATALSILGYIRAVHDRDWIGGIADLERAIQLDPNDAGTVWSLAHVFAMVDRHDEAIRLVEAHATRRPDNGRNHLEVANRQIDARRYEDALLSLASAEARNAEPARVADMRGVVAFAQGRYDDARSLFEFALKANNRASGTLSRYATTLGVVDRTEDAQRLVDELINRLDGERISDVTMARAMLGIGDHDRALELLGRAVASGDRDVVSVRHDPFFDAIRDHARFHTAMAALNLPDAP
ncbi:MAG: winged helix-turn-helix domain-containing protein [Pseudomonadota bacterium]